MEIFVTCPSGLEDILLKELVAIGIDGAHKAKGGVYVPREIVNVYRVNYLSHIASRVLWPITAFPCPDRHALYSSIRQIDWSNYLNLKKTFAIDANVINHPNLRNSLFAAMVVKDAICDLFRDRTGARPNIDVAYPNVQLNLFINQNHATIYLDTSGAPLHKRGYRKHNTVAPLHETLAAAILALCGYDSNEIFCDPFCGSGTFLIEAAMMATRTPPGIFRKNWGFFNLPEYSDSAWKEFKNQANSEIVPLPKGMIFGADLDAEAINICQQNIEAAGFKDAIEIERKDIRSYFPAIDPTFLLCNPPYGKRLKSTFNIFPFIGEFLKTRGKSITKAFFLAPTPQCGKETGLPFSELIELSNGGLPISLLKSSI